MNQSLLTRLETLEQSSNSIAKIHVTRNGNGLIVHADKKEDERIYFPNDTGEQFHNDSNFVRLIKGPYGSGKSTGCCVEIVLRTMDMPAWSSGIRRSKWAIVRNTSGELMTTTLQTWLHWFQSLGTYVKRQKPVMTYVHTFRDKDGLCEIELIFLALDREDDLRKVRSLEVTGVYINEASEVPMGAFTHFKGRCNRYPAQDICNNYWSGIIADTNPPDTDHDIYTLFEKDKPNGHKIFNQPPGLLQIKADEIKPEVESIRTNSGIIYIANTKADNFAHLKSDYYLRMAEGQNEEFIKVFCLGQYGAVIMGKRVYPEYNDDFHSANDMNWIPTLPIHLFWDFGLTPACVIAQESARGQLRIMKEFVAYDMGIKQFAESVVLPYVRSEMRDFTIGYSNGDPAGNQRAQSDESTCMDILNGLGLNTEPAETNNLLKRLEAVKYYLNRLIDGQPAILVSRDGAPVVRKGFLGDYHYKRLGVPGEARYQDEPNKNKASHPHDALQYCAMRFCSAELMGQNKVDVANLLKAVQNRPFKL